MFAPNINICIVVEFCKVYEIEVLHDAINKVIKKDPLLRASLQFDEKGNAFYNIEAEAEAEISSMRISTDTSWTSIVAQEQKKPFVLTRKPLIRFTSLEAEKKMQLIMCVHHILADGLSCVKIVKDIMSFVNAPNQPITIQAPNLLEDSTLKYRICLINFHLVLSLSISINFIVLGVKMLLHSRFDDNER